VREGWLKRVRVAGVGLLVACFLYLIFAFFFLVFSGSGGPT
jgi:hypothetical protein